MATKKAKSGNDIPEWLVTFADLMSILVCFFVLLISFSIQDTEKLQVVAGSMRDAFGLTRERRAEGMVERIGNPERDYLRDVTTKESDESVQIAAEDHDKEEFQGPEVSTTSEPNMVDRSHMFALAAASIRQAWQESPEITEISDNLVVTETQEGLEILIVDQKGRPMFPEGSKYPFEVTRKAIAAMAPALNKLGQPIIVEGHVAAGGMYATPTYGPWDLSTDRANVTRRILNEFGLSDGLIASVAGLATAEPLFPNDPYLSANQRVAITVTYEKPPVPIGLSP